MSDIDNAFSALDTSPLKPSDLVGTGYTDINNINKVLDGNHTLWNNMVTDNSSLLNNPQNVAITSWSELSTPLSTYDVVDDLLGGYITISFRAIFKNITGFTNGQAARVNLGLKSLDPSKPNINLGVSVGPSGHTGNEQQVTLTTGQTINQTFSYTYNLSNYSIATGQKGVVTAAIDGIAADSIQIDQFKVERGMVATPYQVSSRDAAIQANTLLSQVKNIGKGSGASGNLVQVPFFEKADPNNLTWGPGYNSGATLSLSTATAIPSALGAHSTYLVASGGNIVETDSWRAGNTGDVVYISGWLKNTGSDVSTIGLEVQSSTNTYVMVIQSLNGSTTVSNGNTNWTYLSGYVILPNNIIKYRPAVQIYPNGIVAMVGMSASTYATVASMQDSIVNTTGDTPSVKGKPLSMGYAPSTPTQIAAVPSGDDQPNDIDITWTGDSGGSIYYSAVVSQSGFPDEVVPIFIKTNSNNSSTGNNNILRSRNLLSNSQTFNFSYNTSGKFTKEILSFNNDTNMLHMYAPKGTGSDLGIFIFPQNATKKGQKYTISFDIRGTGTFPGYPIGVEGASDYKITGGIMSDWSRMSITGTAPKYGNAFVLYFDATNSVMDVYIKLPKIEFGDTATPWTPAPNDPATGKFFGTASLPHSLASTTTSIRVFGTSIYGVTGSVSTPVNVNDVDIYGASWDMTQHSDLTRTDSAVGLQAGINGAQNDFDSLGPWQGMYRYTDDLGNAMVRIPKFYIRKTQDNGKGSSSDGPTTGAKATWQVSRVNPDPTTTYSATDTGWYLPKVFWDFNKHVELPYADVGAYEASVVGNKLASVSGVTPTVNTNINQFRAFANNTGNLNGYQLMDVHMVDVLQTLFIIEFATLDSQSIMRGNVDSKSAWDAGGTDNISGSSGTPGSAQDGTHSINYRGVENLWGNVSTFIDGTNLTGGIIYTSPDSLSYASDKFTAPYQSVGSIGQGAYGWLVYQILNPGIPSTQFAGFVDASTKGYGYYNDYFWAPTSVSNTVALYGGNNGTTTGAGLFYLEYTRPSSNTDANSGSRLQKKAIS